MQRTNESKSIMRRLRESNKEAEVKNESLIMNEAEDEDADADTENDASESDLLLARLEDIISRFEKVIAAATGEDEEEGEEDTPEEGEEEEAPEEEEPAEDEEGEEEEEEPAEESYERSLEDRLAALERRFTEARRRYLCRNFRR